MKKLLGILCIVFSIPFFLFFAYFAIQTQFVLNVRTIPHTDGLGFSLYSGHHALLDNIVIWGIGIVSVGIGLALIGLRKKFKEDQKD